MTDRLHDDELAVDEDLVRRLVDGRLPSYAGTPLRRLPASGSSNALFRLGDDLLVRVPRQPGGGASVTKEARWLPVVGPHLGVPLPEVVAVGEPGWGYPERWSVTTWLAGRTPAPVTAATPPGSRQALADDLAALVRRLRLVPVPPEACGAAELDWYRAGPLTGLDGDMRAWVDRCRTLDLDLDLDAVLRTWERSLDAAARRSPAAQWLHADLVGENLLVDGDGRLAGLLDLGGLAVGDPAVDLVGAWELLDPRSRASFRAATGVDEATWLVAAGWALLIAVMTFPYYGATMPGRCAARLAMAQQVLADPSVTASRPS